MNKRVKSLIECGIFAALISVLSLISVPLPFLVPVTLQSFIVPFAGYYLGCKKGLISYFVYLATGLLGIPVFSSFQGGFHVLLGPTGGFLLGFIPFVFLSGVGNKLKNKLKSFFMGFAGLILCHAFGVVQYSFYTSQGFISAFITCSLPFILKDILFLYISLVLTEKIKGKLK